MNKFITDITINVVTLDEKGNPIRTDALEYNTEEGEEVVLTQEQLRDAIDTLFEYVDTPSIQIPKAKDIKEPKEKKSSG